MQIEESDIDGIGNDHANIPLRMNTKGKLENQSLVAKEPLDFESVFLVGFNENFCEP